MQDEIILGTRQLKKYFRKVQAVDGVSLRVRRGQIYGFLGPNGAGKTTTIALVLGLLHPDSGEVTLFGEPLTPARTAVLRRVGALVGSPALVPYLSARRNLELIARLDGGETRTRPQEILEKVGLSQAANRKAGQFSTGMRQRLGLGMALLHQPELLILDEPTNGMDPAGMREIRLLLRELAGQGVTIFLSSHLLHEVEQICDRVAVLNKGRIIAEGTVNELLGEQKVVRARVPSPAEAARILQDLPTVEAVEVNGLDVTTVGVTSQEVIAHLVSRGIVPSQVTYGRSDLESIFLQLTQ